MLGKMGFHPKWIRNVMCCVRSVIYDVKYNDQLTDIIFPGRGLRQGDPFSLYLFIICSDWLSWKISQQQAERKLYGIKICRGATPITHLFFFLQMIPCYFLKTKQLSVETLKQILSDYEVLSGQKISYAKSEICLSRNIASQDSLWITNALKVKKVDNHGSYLGLPFPYGSNKSDAFWSFIEKV